MNKPSTLIAAAALAFVGFASAQTFDVPVHQPGEASTMTMGAPNQLTQNYAPLPAPVVVYESVDTTVLGAPPVVIYDSADTTVLAGPGHVDFHGSATNWSSVPDRAGELSTMNGGAPNMVP